MGKRTHLLTGCLAVILLSLAQASIRVIEQGPSEEIVSLRDGHTRAFKVRSTLEVTNPDTGTVEITEATSRYFTKGMGLCYRLNGEWVVANPHWVATPEGFAVAEAAYTLTAGPVLSSGVVVSRRGKDHRLTPSRIEIGAAAGEKELLTARAEVRGSINPDDSTCLIFPGAFGPGIDLCYRLTTGELHQDIVFSQKPPLPLGLEAKDAEVKVLTEIELASAAAAGIIAESGSEQIAMAVGQAASSGRAAVAPLTVAATGQREDGLIFITSRVHDSSPTSRKVDLASRSVTCDAMGTIELSETLSYRFFQEAQLPVTWDYVLGLSPIEADTVLQQGATYFVVGSVVVSGPGVTLRIEGGATLKFYPGISPITLACDAVLVAEGGPYSYVTFTSADDTNCGQTLDQLPTGLADSFLSITGWGCSDSRVRFCRFTRARGIYGMVRVDFTLSEPLRDNVFLQAIEGGGHPPTNCAVYLALESGYNQNEVRNNLIVASGPDYGESGIYLSGGHFYGNICNNTFADYTMGFSYPIRTSGAYSILGSCTGNIFSNCYTATNANPGIMCFWNAFHKTLTWGFASYDWGWGPSPFVVKPTGSFYLAPAYQAATSFETVGAAGLYEYKHELAVFTNSGPDWYLGSSPEIVGTGPIYGSAQQLARVGFHAARIDCVVPRLPGGAHVDNLTIRNGARVAFMSDASICGVNSGGGTLTCEGDDTYGWVILLNHAAASTIRETAGPRFIESPAYGELPGEDIWFGDANGNYTITAKKARFICMSSGILAHPLSQLSITNCEFIGCYHGIETYAAKVEVLNCLFYFSTYGCYLCTADGSDDWQGGPLGSWVMNCTFDSGNDGVMFWEPGITFQDNLFTDCTRGLHNQPATFVSPWIEHHNAFFNNAFNFHNSFIVSERSYRLGNLHGGVPDPSPYDRTTTERSVWWIKGRYSLIRPEAAQILIEDAGSLPASAALVMAGTSLSSNRYGIVDSGPVDIGYHPITFFGDQDGDGLPDRWEAYFQVDSPSAHDDAEAGFPLGDGVANTQEYLNGTDPRSMDTDGDRFTDVISGQPRTFGYDAAVDADNRGETREHGFANWAAGVDLKIGPYVQIKTWDVSTLTFELNVYWGFDDSWWSQSPQDTFYSRRSRFDLSGDSARFGAMTSIETIPQGDSSLVLRRVTVTLPMDNPETPPEGVDARVYYYKIALSGGGRTVETPIYWFRVPIANTTGFTFAAYGCSNGDPSINDGGYQERHQNLLEELLKDPSFNDVHFLVHTGNLVENGGASEDWRDHLFNPAARVLRDIPLLAVAGPLEYMADSNLEKLHRYLDYPGEVVGGHTNYSFTHVNAKFILADTEQDAHPDLDYDDYIFDQLHNTESHWNFVFFHIPGYSDTTEHPFSGGDLHITNARHALFDRARYQGEYLDNQFFGVTLVACGHNNVFEVFDVPRVPPGQDPRLQQLVLGGGGAPQHNLIGTWPRDYDDPESPTRYTPAKRLLAGEWVNYAIVSVDNEASEVRVRVEYFDVNELDNTITHAGTHEFTTTRGK